MKLSKITHHHEVRILVEFPYNAEITTRLRQIPDTRWSKTHKSWHIPYTKEAFDQLRTMFPDVEYISAVETRHATSVQPPSVETRHATSLPEIAPEKPVMVSKKKKMK